MAQEKPPLQILKPAIWEGVHIEEQTLSPDTLVQPKLDRHRIVVDLGTPHVVEIRRNHGWEKIFYPAGNFSLVPYGQGNEVRWHIPIRMLIITMERDFLQELLQFDKTSLAEQRGVEDATICQLVRAIKREVQLTGSPRKLFWQSLTVSLSVHLVSKYGASGKQLFAPRGKLSSTQLKQVIEYCDASLKNDIGLDDLARQAHLSTFHFARLFKNTLGITPHQFVLQLRIEQAKRFLRRNDHSYTHIAYELGFADQAHFTNTFKRVTGVTPSQFLHIN